MSSSDETTGTGEKHEPVQDGYRDHCGTCWRGVEVSAPPGEVRYRVSRAPWPCENARLRERVAALEAIADGAFDDVVRVVAGTAEYESAEWRVRLTLLLPKLSAALAQADDGGRA